MQHGSGVCLLPGAHAASKQVRRPATHQLLKERVRVLLVRAAAGRGRVVAVQHAASALRHQLEAQDGRVRVAAHVSTAAQLRLFGALGQAPVVRSERRMRRRQRPAALHPADAVVLRRTEAQLAEAAAGRGAAEQQQLQQQRRAGCR